MKLLVVGADSPVGRELIGLLHERKIEYFAPDAKETDARDPVNVARVVTQYDPDQVVSLASFRAGSQLAVLEAEEEPTICDVINHQQPSVLAQVCDHLNIPLVHLSSAYVFDGQKKLAYNEQDAAAPKGVYGATARRGEEAIAQVMDRYVILRCGWLFGKGQEQLLEQWIEAARKGGGEIPVLRRKFSPTSTEDIARVVVAVCLQIDCQASVWGTYHYCGVETRRESEFVQHLIKLAAQHDEEIYQRLDRIEFNSSRVEAPVIANSTLSSKKIFDTFGIKQRSWHGSLQAVVKSLYSDGRP